jgi:hypothetical protein
MICSPDLDIVGARCDPPAVGSRAAPTNKTEFLCSEHDKDLKGELIVYSYATE